MARKGTSGAVCCTSHCIFSMVEDVGGAEQDGGRGREARWMKGGGSVGARGELEMGQQ